MATAGKYGAFVLGKYNLTPYLNKITQTQTTDKADTSVFGPNKSSVPGQYVALFGLTGWFDPVAGGYSEAISAYMAGPGTGTPVPAVLALPTTGVVGDPAFLLNGWVGTKNLDVAVTGAVPLVSEVNGQTALDTGVLMTATIAQSVAITTTLGEVDNLAATTNGWSAALSVHAITGAAPSVVVTIEHSITGGGAGFSTLCTFAAKTAAGFEYKTGVDNPVKRYLRAIITFGGTTATFVSTIAFARR